MPELESCSVGNCNHDEEKGSDGHRSRERGAPSPPPPRRQYHPMPITDSKLHDKTYDLRLSLSLELLRWEEGDELLKLAECESAPRRTKMDRKIRRGVLLEDEQPPVQQQPEEVPDHLDQHLPLELPTREVEQELLTLRTMLAQKDAEIEELKKNLTLTRLTPELLHRSNIANYFQYCTGFSYDQFNNLCSVFAVPKTAESTLEFAPIKEISESTSEFTSLQEISESIPEYTPAQEISESTSQSVPAQETSESAPELALAWQYLLPTPEFPVGSVLLKLLGELPVLPVSLKCSSALFWLSAKLSVLVFCFTGSALAS
ncbi:hypothetical protein Q8A67_018759 [Cirrhinus molitorella]|uniref:Uncharacterized protein n=1 Tax=Cirrhinus molitorella TaxID=172907 RepID=A0AA88P9T3_9TELE|nr:hypothetical protein Q8A67_018759 [Cirrhinus molitorella]